MVVATAQEPPLAMRNHVRLPPCEPAILHGKREGLAICVGESDRPVHASKSTPLRVSTI